MSQSRRRRLLQCHKALKQKLISLGLMSLADAKNMLAHDVIERAEVMGRVYSLTIHADQFDDEVVVGAWLTRRALLCGEGYSSGLLFKRSGEITYLSQKKLWAHGY